jgi:hypothetical protein
MEVFYACFSAFLNIFQSVRSKTWDNWDKWVDLIKAFKKLIRKFTNIMKLTTMHSRNIFTSSKPIVRLLLLLLREQVAQPVQWLAAAWTAGLDSWQKHRMFSLASASRPVLGPTQPPVHLVLDVLSQGEKRGRCVMLTTHPLLVPRSRSRSHTSSHPRRHLGV